MPGQVCSEFAHEGLFSRIKGSAWRTREPLQDGDDQVGFSEIGLGRKRPPNACPRRPLVPASPGPFLEQFAHLAMNGRRARGFGKQR
jgi:hypothetical protein